MSSSKHACAPRSVSLAVASARRQPELGLWLQQRLPLKLQADFVAAVAKPAAMSAAPCEVARPGLRKCAPRTQVTPMSAQLQWFARSLARSR